ncbi:MULTISPECIES: dTMP kinase [unclassified Moritella]|uniref:dTMP kinase n=1 Tax=unclassified Moritella TaxID=2637987 RepID=UPI001BAC9210|nr:MULTISPECIES: dTMP kinase [unclassified Moritella]QUM80890.1 dTMP kinase [Moritella sp. 5]QUM85174.1 dTMP kinase [Moritella sp. 28]
MQAKFLVIEGLEGAGKSTAVSTVINWLAEQGITDVITTREPGGTKLAEKMRAIVKEVDTEEPLTESAELMLMYAARAQLVENVIKPALAKGQWVVGDRHDLSSIAYQGGGRGFDIGVLNTLRQVAIGDFKPDMTLLLDIDPAVGLERAKVRGELDRIELEQLSFFQRIGAKYQELAAADDTIYSVDAGQNIDNVQAQIRDVLTANANCNNESVE